MYGREYFHESVVRDVVDVLTSLKDYDEVQFINNKNHNRSFKSITSATKDLILTFPVLVSSDIDPATAIMISKAHEKKCASLLHMLFTAICVDSSDDVYDYIKKFHTNLGNISGTLDSYADAFDKIAATYESYDQTLKIDKEVLNTVLEDLKESNYILPDNLKESSLESYSILPGYRTGMNDMIVKEAKTMDSRTARDYANAKATVAKFNSLWGNVDPSKIPSDAVVRRDTAQAYIDSIDNTDINNDSNTTNTRNINRTNVQSGEVTYNHHQYQHSGGDTIGTMTASDRAKFLKDITQAHSNVVLSNEYKKANELQPTMMVVNFIRNDANNQGHINTAVIGIKAKLYPVTSADIRSRVTRKLEDRNFLTNFVRATTSEIGFFRDFLFAIDSAKIDAKSYGRKATSNKLWKVLERRSTKSKFRRSLKMSNDATAISTLLLSANDVEYMKKYNSIDLMNVTQARKILDAYNFMCICIANEATEVASFLYDTGEDTYEMIPFTGLEREASDNSYKKMVNLLTKVSR